MVSRILRMKYSQFVVWNFVVGAVYVLSVGPAAYAAGKVAADEQDGASLGALVAGLAIAAGCTVLAPGEDDLLEPAGDLAVHHGGQAGSAVEDGDGHAERGEDGGVLDPDRAAAHDQQLAWLAGDVHEGLGVEDAGIVEGHAGRAQRA